MENSDVKEPIVAPSHLRIVVPIAKRPAEISGKDLILAFLDKLRADIVNDDYAPTQMVVLVLEESDDTTKLYPLLCNSSIIEACGLMAIATSDLCTNSAAGPA